MYVICPLLTGILLDYAASLGVRTHDAAKVNLALSVLCISGLSRVALYAASRLLPYLLHF